MKHKIFVFLALLLTLTAACAGAQQRPGVGCFSPGLVRVSEKMKENPTVSADVTLTVESLGFFRLQGRAVTALYAGTPAAAPPQGATIVNTSQL